MSISIREKRKKPINASDLDRLPRVTVRLVLWATVTMSVISLSHRGALAQDQQGADWGGYEQPSLARGLDERAVIQAGSTDNVNLANGIVTLAIPLGQSYTVSPTLSYQLTLVGTSQPWDFQQDQCAWQPLDNPPDTQPVDYYMAVPSPLSNAGMGWSLNMGRLLQPYHGLPQMTPLRPEEWTFVDASGAKHAFFVADYTGLESNGNTLYTRDGSLLRMTRRDAGDSSCNAGSPCRTIEFPDGRIMDFNNVRNMSGARDPWGEDQSDWRVTRIRDHAGYRVDIDYQANKWVVTDSHGRRHEVFFAGSGYERIVEVRLSSFGDNVSTNDGLVVPSASYLFDYGPSKVSVPRHRFAEWAAHLPVCGEYPVTTLWPNPGHIDNAAKRVWQLRQITHPDMSTQLFTYGTEDSYAPDESGMVAGALASLTDRLSIKTEYEYETLYFSDLDDFEKQFEAPAGSPGQLRFGSPSTTTAGLAEKRVIGTGVAGTRVWKYKNIEASAPTPYGLCHRRVDVEIFGPGNDQTPIRSVAHFFNAYDGTAADIGLNNRAMTFCEAGADDDNHRTVTFNPNPPNANYGYLTRIHRDVSGQWTKKEYTKYARVNQSVATEHHDSDYRPIVTTEVFNRGAYPNRYKQVKNLDPDALGYFTRTDRLGDFSNQDHRITERTFEPMPKLTDPWVPGRITRESRRIPGQRSFVTTSCYEDGPYPSIPVGRRVLAGQTPSDIDVVTTTEYTDAVDADPTLLVSIQKTFGGDRARLPENHSDCRAPENVEPEYVTRTTMKFGAKKSKAYLRPVDHSSAFTAVPIVVELDGQIDQATGLPRTSTDAHGVESRFKFDEMGRLARAQPSPEDAVLFYRYLLPSQDADVAYARQTVRACETSNFALPICDPGNDQGIREIRRDVVEMDGHGQPGTQYRDLPQAVTAKSVLHRDILGRVTKAHEWSISSPTLFTHYRGLDYFGRPSEVIKPDGHRSYWHYLGLDFEQLETRVMTDQGIHPSFTTTRKNIHGEVVSVKQSLKVGENSSLLSHTYDATGNVIESCNEDSGTSSFGSCGGQRRTATFDGRGFMTREKVPEQAERLMTYDSMGNLVTTAFYGTNKGFVRSHYDAAGRLVRAEDFDGNPLTESFYARRDNAELGHVRNAVVQTRRHNTIPTADGAASRTVVVTDTLKYATHGARRLQSATVRASIDDGPLFELGGLQYDLLGNLQRYTQPTCISLQCEGQSIRVIETEHDAGMPVSIPGYVDHVGYEVNGAIKSIAHRNGFIDRYSRFDHSASQWAPIGSISLHRGDSEVWALSDYQYDDAGNIVSMVSHGQTLNFRYDLASRMTYGEVADGDPNDAGSVTIATQRADYDRFDNLKHLLHTRADAADMEVSVDASTNRINDGSADYDTRGNTTEARLGSLTATFSYDALNQITNLNLGGDPSHDRSFLYNAAGQRVATLRDGRWEWVVRAAHTRPQSVFISDLVSPASSLSRRTDYVYLGSRHVASDRYGDDGSVHTVHYHRDHLGSTRRVSSGNDIIQAYDMLPYGGYVYRPTENESEKLQFTGHERDRGVDATSDLDYMMARYYSPHLGRFLQVDPARDGWNLYGYVGGNPLSRVDPTGLKSASLSDDLTAVSIATSDSIAGIAGTVATHSLGKVPGSLAVSNMHSAASFSSMANAEMRTAAYHMARTPNNPRVVAPLHRAQQQTVYANQSIARANQYGAGAARIAKLNVVGTIVQLGVEGWIAIENYESRSSIAADTDDSFSGSAPSSQRSPLTNLRIRKLQVMLAELCAEGSPRACSALQLDGAAAPSTPDSGPGEVLDRPALSGN